MQILRENKKPVLIALLLVVILIASLVIVQIVSTPSQAPSSSIYPGEVTYYQGQNLTSISDFLGDINQHPDVAIDGTQYINQTTYRLAVTGLVSNTSEYSYNELVNNFQSVQQVSTLLCVEGWSVTMLWQGIPIQDLLQEAGASPNATTLIFYASDGYTTELPISYVVQNNLILAYKVNNVTLPAAAGFPLTLVAQNQYGYKWIKWITRIDVSNDSSYLGYWESRGYPNNATVNGGDPSNSPTLWDKIPVAEVIAASVVGIAITAIVYTTLRRWKKGEMRSSSSSW
jgi:DMSO/TMAO reductase YedYZ molybdopterin-dependent catalytic subunit